MDKPKLEEVLTASKIYWKCSTSTCSGRGNSAGLKPPLIATKPHNHLPCQKQLAIHKKQSLMKERSMAANNLA